MSSTALLSLPAVLIAPSSLTERLNDQSGELWSTTELQQADGDYFNVDNFPSTAPIPITDASVFTYSLSITYDDGLVVSDSESWDVAAQCAAQGQAPRARW